MALSDILNGAQNTSSLSNVNSNGCHSDFRNRLKVSVGRVNSLENANMFPHVESWVLNTPRNQKPGVHHCSSLLRSIYSYSKTHHLAR